MKKKGLGLKVNSKKATIIILSDQKYEEKVQRDVP